MVVRYVVQRSANLAVVRVPCGIHVIEGVVTSTITGIAAARNNKEAA